MILDTGAKRSVVGNAVSGGVAGLLVASYINYKDYKNGAITQGRAISNTLSVGAQAAIATGCAIGVANALGDNSKSNFQALLESGAYILVGVAGVYAVSSLSETKKIGANNGK